MQHNIDKIPEFTGSYRFLSNFHPSPMEIDGESYPTVEHYYQAAKAVSEKDRKTILHARTPGEAKRLGRKIAMRQDWEDVKVEAMEKALRAKFSDPTLAAQLLSTGQSILEEGNRHHDSTWGIDLHTGHGENLLGKLLMKIRDDIADAVE